MEVLRAGFVYLVLFRVFVAIILAYCRMRGHIGLDRKTYYNIIILLYYNIIILC